VAEERMDLLMESIRAIRNMRAEVKVGPGQKVNSIIQTDDEDSYHTFVEGHEYICDMAEVESLEIRANTEENPAKALASIVGGAEVYLPLEGLIDVGAELKRLQSELDEAREYLAESRSRLANEDFVEKAPREVVNRERERVARQSERVTRLEERIEQLQQLT
jgi:valyl-tRNA synthetase